MVSFQDNGIGKGAIGPVSVQGRELRGEGRVRLRTVSLGRGLVV